MADLANTDEFAVQQLARHKSGGYMNKQSLRTIANPLGTTTTRILVLFALSTLGFAQQAAQKDNFDFWQLKQQYGTVTLSTDQNHTPGGTQSLKFASSPGGQREMHATHSFKSLTNGNFTVWFYDVAPGQETLYEQVSLRDSVSGWSASMGTEDFDAYCYMTQLYNSNTQQNLGPNANCGIYPQTTTTPIVRTTGWHKLCIQVGNTNITFSIDGAVVFTYAGQFAFDSVDLLTSGPAGRPDTVAYFDDFSFQPLRK
jgi:hypothetical protein